MEKKGLKFSDFLDMDIYIGYGTDKNKAAEESHVKVDLLKIVSVPPV